MTDERDPTERAIEAISRCAEAGAETLSLSSYGLSELPPELFQLSTLRELNLAFNQLTSLPEEIGQLSGLVRLDVRKNAISLLPGGICDLTALGALELGSNQLSSFPAGFSRLTSLTQLDVYQNRFPCIPEEVFSLTELQVLGWTHNDLEEIPTQISNLRDLRRLYLGFNKLQYLPEELVELTRLRGLYLHNNLFSQAPAPVGRMASLKELTLGANPLDTFPENVCGLSNLTRLSLAECSLEDVSSKIGQLSSLVTLELDNNSLTSLPEQTKKLSALRHLGLSSNSFRRFPAVVTELASLESLALANNSLAALPASIGNLGELRSLDLSGNVLPLLPFELALLENLSTISIKGNLLPSSYFDAIDQGLDSFRALLNSLSEATQPLYEAKLLVTGEGQVGKSWTLAKLKGLDPTSAVGPDNTTWGIDRDELELDHPFVKGQRIRLNTWDFGGQKIYRVTHQFFFSEQAIYILVWNPRQGAEQCRVREWLRMIALRTGSGARTSGRKGDLPRPRAKVIMVATHAQSEGGSYNPDYGRASLDQDLRDMIVDETQVDSKTGHGIAHLRTLIARHAATLPDMGQPFNVRWAAARDAVLKLRQTKPWIDFEEFASVCAAHDVAEQDEMRTLAWTYLHSLGRAIWYGSVSLDDGEPAEALLDHTIVLDAVWLSRAFVQVLDDETTQNAGGMLDHRRFPAIWTTHSRPGWHVYQPIEYEILKLVMRRFDVALPTRESQGTRSLVPQLVPYQRPSALPWTRAAEARGARTIRLSCQLGFEASGLMARLIAATEPWHLYVDRVGLYWEGGVFLRETASYDNEALITIEGNEKPRIDVVVSGNQPGFLMHELYRTVESVLAFWRGMTRAYFVSCPMVLADGGYCAGAFKYDAIVRRIEERVDAKFDCQECDSVWPAERLILGFGALSSNDSYMLNHLYRRDQIPCPRTFLLEPADKEFLKPTSWTSILGKRFKLTLVSELSGRKVADAEFVFTRDWVKWVKPLTKLASIALTGLAVPVDGVTATEFKESASLLDKMSAMPEGEPDNLLSAQRYDNNLRIPRESLVNFSRFLDAIGLNPRDHGMDLAPAPDDRWLWMSPDEVPVYSPQEAAPL